MTIFDSGSPPKNTTVTTRITIESVNDNSPKLTVSVSGGCLVSVNDEDVQRLFGLVVSSSRKKRQVVFRQSSRNDVRLSSTLCNCVSLIETYCCCNRLLPRVLSRSMRLV